MISKIRLHLRNDHYPERTVIDYRNARFDTYRSAGLTGLVIVEIVDSGYLAEYLEVVEQGGFVVVLEELFVADLWFGQVYLGAGTGDFVVLYVADLRSVDVYLEPEFDADLAALVERIGEERRC